MLLQLINNYLEDTPRSGQPLINFEKRKNDI